MHCAAIYDITVGEAEQRAANVEGTRAVIELTRRLDATLHHVSSIAVAGDFAGEYTEDDFDVGQQLPTPYHQTKFEAESLVRSTPGLRYRVYRPAVVVGDSRTGEMDKIDGPYYFFGVLAKLAVLPSLTPVLLPDTGRTNIVPVDYVVDALVALMHAEGSDGQTFHLTAPKSIGLRGIYRGVARRRAAPAARVAAALAGGPGAHGERTGQGAAQHGGHPAGNPGRGFGPRRPGADFHQLNRPGKHCRAAELRTFRNSPTTRPSCGGTGPSTSTPTVRVATIRTGALQGRHVIITGASSGIGRASAIAVAQRGATVFALARNADALDELVAEIRATGGQAHAFTCDVTDSVSVEHTIKDILGRFGHVDYLVNNAGRSIRRSVVNSTDRLHDYERVMAVNYFGAVRMVLALLPHWRERRFGHVVNVSSAGVLARNPNTAPICPPRRRWMRSPTWSPPKRLSDHITFTNIHMPLVKTPMIAPSQRLNPVPPISPERAAAMVVRGLVDKPPRIDTPMGTLAEAGNYFTPKLSRRFLHQLYLGYPDSAAARGVAPASTDATNDPILTTPRRRPKRPVRAVNRTGSRDRSNNWCGGCPACIGSHFDNATERVNGISRRAARFRRRRHGRRRCAGVDLPAGQPRSRRRRHRLNRWKRCGTTGL